jgi:hypothetical protein
MTSVFSYLTLKENASVHNEAMPLCFSQAGIEFVGVPCAIKLKDKTDCKPLIYSERHFVV